MDTGLLVALRTAAQEGEVDEVESISGQIRDHVDQIQEVVLYILFYFIYHKSCVIFYSTEDVNLE